MAWVVIRKVTDEDYEALNKAARRFIARHPELSKFVQSHLDYTGEKLDQSPRGLWSALDQVITFGRDDESRSRWTGTDYVYLARLWKRCIARALGHPDAEGIAWDTVGHTEKE